MTSNIFKSVLLGALITAVIQSSSATTVIVVGLVNSGILKLDRAIGIIMGDVYKRQPPGGSAATASPSSPSGRGWRSPGWAPGSKWGGPDPPLPNIFYSVKVKKTIGGKCR